MPREIQKDQIRLCPTGLAASREAKITASFFREIHKWKLERETALSMQTKESDGKEIRLGLISFGTQRKQFSPVLLQLFCC